MKLLRELIENPILKSEQIELTYNIVLIFTDEKIYLRYNNSDQRNYKLMYFLVEINIQMLIELEKKGINFTTKNYIEIYYYDNKHEYIYYQINEYTPITVQVLHTNHLNSNAKIKIKNKIREYNLKSLLEI